jgi:hypothetical protein
MVIVVVVLGFYGVVTRKIRRHQRKSRFIEINPYPATMITSTGTNT